MDDSTPKRSWWRRLSDGLKRTSSSIGQAVADLVTKRKLDRAMLDDIEDVLLRADLGSDVAARIAAAVGEGRYDKAISADEVKEVVATEVEKVLSPVAKPLAIEGAKPFVILVVGVNGSGKTTTIGKLASKFRSEGRKVMLAAGDTFRAAAIEQLKIWGERTGAPVIARTQGSDAAGLAFDALTAAEERLQLYQDNARSIAGQRCASGRCARSAARLSQRRHCRQLSKKRMKDGSSIFSRSTWVSTS